MFDLDSNFEESAKRKFTTLYKKKFTVTPNDHFVKRFYTERFDVWRIT